MSRLIGKGERVVTIEGAAELQLQQPHAVRLETRAPNLEGRGEVAMRDLVRNALRMRPNRIPCGGVRGAEALDMLQAMDKGHDGPMRTLHANSPREAVTRLENTVGTASTNLPARAGRRAERQLARLERRAEGQSRPHRAGGAGAWSGCMFQQFRLYR